MGEPSYARKKQKTIGKSLLRFSLDIMFTYGKFLTFLMPLSHFDPAVFFVYV